MKTIFYLFCILGFSNLLFAQNYTWTEQNGSGQRNWVGIASSSDGTKLAALVRGGYIYTSSNSGVTWIEQTGSGIRWWWSIASSSDGNKLIASVENGYIYTSSNSGNNWISRSSSGDTWRGVSSSSDGTKLAACKYYGYIYTSSNSGDDWIERTNSGNKRWMAITSSYDGSKIYAGLGDVTPDYIYLSTNYGSNWTELTSSGSGNWRGITSSSDGTKIAAVDANSYIYISTNSGTSWTECTSAGNRSWNGIASSSNGTIIAAIYMNGYIYVSTNSGSNWSQQIIPGNRSWTGIAISSDGSKIVATAYDGYIWTGVLGTSNSITTSTISGSPFCVGSSVSVPFTISGTYNTGNIFTAQLSNSSGNFSSPTNIGTLSGTTAGTINCTIPKSTSAGTGYRIRVISSNPAITGTDNGTNLTINTVPSPVITGSTSLCKDEISDYKSNTGAGLTYSWTVTGGTVIGQTNLDSLIVDWTTAGNGKVKLVQTNSNGCKDSTEKNITINNAPTPSIQNGPTDVCEKKTYSYSSNSDPSVNYFWSVEKGTIESGATSQIVTVKWDSVGIATAGKVKLLQINNSTGCKDSSERFVTINPLPRVGIIGMDTVGLNRKDYYKAKDSVGLTSAWIATGGTILSNPMSHYAIVDWKTVGQGTLKLTQTSVASGCMDTALISVTILDNPPISITVLDSACENNESVYSTSTGTNIEYKWTCNMGTIQGNDNQSTVVIKWGQAGNGSVKLVRRNTELNAYDSTSKNIKIHPLPTTSILNVQDSVFLGSTVKYWAKDAGKYDYRWVVNQGSIQGSDNQDTVTIKWDSEGKGNIKLFASDKTSACEDSTNADFEIYEKSEIIIFDNQKNEVCQNDSASYETDDVIGATNKWTVTGGTIDSQTNTRILVTWELAGTGKVKLVQDISTIGIMDSTEIQVKVNPQPIVTIPNFPDICLKDTTYQIKGGEPDGGTYFIDETEDSTFNPVNLGAGTHIIRYEFTDSSGCSNYAEKLFEVNPEPLQPTITETGNTLTASPGSKFQWYYQGKPIPGATGSVHNPDTSGIYSVKAIDDIGCESKLSEFHYYPLGSDGAIIVGDFARDFGLIDCEYVKYDTVNIQNPGKETLTISKAEIKGNDKDDFKLIPSFQQTDIPTKGNKDFIIQLLPAVAGEKEAELVLSNNSVNDKEFKISLTAIKDSIGFNLSETELNFDYVPENTPQIKEIALTNTGTLPLTWQSAMEINKDFEIISIKPTTTEPNGGTSTIRVIFNGESDGYKTNTEYTFSENQCGRQVKLSLSAIVGDKPVDAIAILKIDTLDKIYKPGDILQVPIYLQSSQNLDKVSITGFTADLVYNATLLVPIMGTPKGTRKNDIRTIPLILSVNPKYDNVLDVLNFEATLGNDTTTTLVLENLKSIGVDSIQVSSNNGRFTLAGVCMEGGVPRLLNTSGQVNLQLLRPNPTENKLTIDYEVIETGQTEIYLVNSFGERVKTIVSKETSKGIYSVDADLNDISSGLYFIILQTPTVRKAEKVEIVK